MDMRIIEYRRIFSRLHSIVPSNTNVSPFIRAILIEEGVDIDELSVKNFLEGHDAVCRRMEFETRDELDTTLRPGSFLCQFERNGGLPIASARTLMVRVYSSNRNGCSMSTTSGHSNPYHLCYPAAVSLSSH
jgi:hypothetical protein